MTTTAGRAGELDREPRSFSEGAFDRFEQRSTRTGLWLTARVAEWPTRFPTTPARILHAARPGSPSAAKNAPAELQET